MNKKVVFNGIEFSLPKYNSTIVTAFDYLDKIATHLQDELREDDENFQASIVMDFSTTKPPEYRIQSIGSISKKTKEKVGNILKKIVDIDPNQISGSVHVNLLVDD